MTQQFTILAGAHLNPAVTLAMACAGRLALIKVFFYWLAQYLGAFAAAASVLGVYSGACITFRKKYFYNKQTNKNKTRSMFMTFIIRCHPVLQQHRQRLFGDE